MKDFTIKRYQSGDYDSWNAFIAKAKNATFLFHRDFMEYHCDRFTDYSLLVYEKDNLTAVLPANISGDTLYSHAGLTYGGLVYTDKMKLASVIEAFRAVLNYLNQNNIATFYIKTLPSIYHLKPTDELQYALFLAEAKLVRRDSLSVIDLQQPYEYSQLRKRGIKKAVLNLLEVRESADFDAFWNDVLIPNLATRHQAAPVHTVEEISRLKSLFPANIRQFNVYYNDTIVGGTTVFESEKVAHCQYISVSHEYNDLGVLDYLFDHLIGTVFSEKQYFDFGISNEAQGRKLNAGLSRWKESFGASTIVQDFYELSTANFSMLENILI